MNTTTHSAGVGAKFEPEIKESKLQFDNCHSSSKANRSMDDFSSEVIPYTKQIDQGKSIQPFGCLLAVEERNFTIIAYSENVDEMLIMTPKPAADIAPCGSTVRIGTDIQSLFQPQSASTLRKAAGFEEVDLLNPILVHCRNSGNPFYATVHKINEGLVIDLEPVDPANLPVTVAGALESYKVATKAISRLQSLPGGNITMLCDLLVREIRELTGYDRVVVYKLHKDEHGEVIAECKKSDLDPILGFHYPATDTPQASRSLSLKNRVRMVCDCTAPFVKVVQDENLAKPLNLCGSTLSAPLGSHAEYMVNFGYIASLVMSVTIALNDDERNCDQEKAKRLWGLVICHHNTSRFIPLPLRHACGFLLHVFGLQLSKEVEFAAQVKEKHILKTRTLLCNMLLRDNPVGVVTQSPNIMNLVTCDGAALHYKSKIWLLGVTPSEAQMRDIIEWLLECHEGTTGLSTESLAEAGFPGASSLGDVVCGMAAIRITSKDFIFWFRSQTAKEIKWYGVRDDLVEKDKMHLHPHPRSSLETPKQRSDPWEEVEMDAIHSLQIILCGSIDTSQNAATTPLDDAEKVQRIDQMSTAAKELVHLIDQAIVPIMSVDASGNMKGWNAKAAELTGLSEKEAIGLPLVNIVDNDSVETAKRMLFLAMQGKDERNVEIKLKTFGDQSKKGPVILVVNACPFRDVKDEVVGIRFITQDMTGEKLMIDKYTRIRGDYIALMNNPKVLIPPIFIIDEYGCCFEWNASMQKLSGLKRDEVINKLVVGEVFSLKFGCRVKDYDTLTKLKIVLNGAIAGRDEEELLFGFFDKKDKYIEALLSVNKRTTSEGKVKGALCFLHVVSPELQNALKMQRMSEKAAINRLKELVFLRQAINNSLHGITFTHNLMEASALTQKQKQLLRTSSMCQEQLKMILDDKDLESIEQCYTETNMEEFNLGETMEAVATQGLSLSKERKVSLHHTVPSEICSMNLYGDNLRLQQVLAEFLLNALQFTPPSEGSVLLLVSPKKEEIGTKLQLIHLEFRIIHPAPGIPEALVQEMFHHSKGISREGLGLYICRKLVKIMNGTVQYLRDEERSSFIINIEFPLVNSVAT